MAPEAHSGGRLIYVANGNDILVLPDRLYDPSIIGRITSGVKGAQGLCVDRDGNLYVANGGGNTVTVYPQGSITPSRTYTEGIDNPRLPRGRSPRQPLRLQQRRKGHRIPPRADEALSYAASYRHYQRDRA